MQLAAVAPQDTNLAKLYFDIGEIYLFIDPQKAKPYYLKLDTLSKWLNWNEGRYLFAAGYTDILNWKGLPDSSIVILQQVLALAKEENNELQIAKILTYIGNCYNYKQWLETALEYYYEALPILEKLNENYRLAHLYSFLGGVYDRLEMPNKSLEYCEKAVQIFENKPDDKMRLQILNNYAFALLSDHSQAEKTEEILLEALRICNLHNDRYHLMSIYCNLGEIAQRKCDVVKLDLYAKKALEIAIEFGDAGAYCILNRGLSYSERLKGNMNKSEEYVREALETAIEYDLSFEKMKCYYDLATLSAARHDFKNFNFYSVIYDSISKAITFEKTQLYAEELETKYETEKKQLEIERQKTIIEKQNLQRGIFIGGIAICVAVLALLFFLLRLRIRHNKT
ncbi:MAG: tetratricopeptide repeat protein, partial [Bacteroidales bacterium]|nr:tetratricopeptide repeat protein [Bacteroidales bacterium]